MHEILHSEFGQLFYQKPYKQKFNVISALGFLHMQSAYDRDDYIDIQWENIQPKANVQFKKHGSNVLTYFGGTYDYDSIMHYPGDAFTKNGKVTMKTKVCRFYIVKIHEIQTNLLWSRIQANRVQLEIGVE